MNWRAFVRLVGACKLAKSGYDRILTDTLAPIFVLQQFTWQRSHSRHNRNVPCGTVRSRDMMTDRTFLRCIGRVNVDHGYASNSGFVFYELPELIEAQELRLCLCACSDRCPLGCMNLQGNQGRVSLLFMTILGMQCCVSLNLASWRKALQMAFALSVTGNSEICLEVIKLVGSFQSSR